MKTPRNGSQTELGVWVRSTFNTAKLRFYGKMLKLCVGSFLLAFPTLILLWKLFPQNLSWGFGVYTWMLGGGMIGFVVTVGAMLWEITHLHSNEPLPLADDLHAIPPLDCTLLSPIY